jgi:acetyl-CoA carboxylase carboxyl transferase subunit beta
MARRQRVSATDLLEDGIIDRIVAEHPDAASEPEAFCKRLAAVLRYELGELSTMSPDAILAHRLRRYSDSSVLSA